MRPLALEYFTLSHLEKIRFGRERPDRQEKDLTLLQYLKKVSIQGPISEFKFFSILLKLAFNDRGAVFIFC